MGLTVVIKGLLPCQFDGDAVPGAPRVWACLLELPAPGALPEAVRQHARQQARTALRVVLADAYGLPADAIQLDDRRGTGVRATLSAGTPLPPDWHTLGLSVSHADSVVLIALRPAGPVGVDLTVLPPDWATGDDEALRQQAALYLGPAHPAAAEEGFASRPGGRPACFVQGWAELEARLKCAEHPLAEWSPALAQSLSHGRSAVLQLPAAIGHHLPAPSSAVVAWRDDL